MITSLGLSPFNTANPILLQTNCSRTRL